MRHVSPSERFSVQGQIIHAISAIEDELATTPTEEQVVEYITLACEAARGEARQRRIEQIIGEICRVPNQRRAS
jgi:hypothetical protein